MAQKPQRQSDVLFRHVGEQIVALNPRTEEVHALEPLAARVFQACDGTVGVSGLADRLNAPPDAVRHVLDSLARADMISGFDRRISRRTALAGGAGLGAGFVASIVLPTPAMAASGPTSPPSQPGPDQPDQEGTSTGTTGTGPRDDDANQDSAPGTPGSNDGPASVREASTPVKGNTKSGDGLAFTGMDVSETMAVAAGAIGTGAAMVAASRKKTQGKTDSK